MRILLDECVNHRLRNYLPGHDCQGARYAGFSGMKNGELLDAAQAANFEVLLTVDRGIAYQQDLNRPPRPSWDAPSQQNARPGDGNDARSQRCTGFESEQ